MNTSFKNNNNNSNNNNTIYKAPERPKVR